MTVAMGSTRFSPITKTRHANVDENSINCRRRGYHGSTSKQGNIGRPKTEQRRITQDSAWRRLLRKKTRKARRELDASIGAFRRVRLCKGPWWQSSGSMGAPARIERGAKNATMIKLRGQRIRPERVRHLWTPHLERHIFSLIYTHMRGSSRVFVVRTSRVMSHLHALMCLFRLSSTTPLSSLCWPSSLLSSCLSSWPSTSSSTMWWTNSLCTLANEDLGTLAEYDPLTGYMSPTTTTSWRLLKHTSRNPRSRTGPRMTLSTMT